MRNILLAGKIKYMLVILLLLTMVPALALEAEIRIEPVFNELNIPSDIPRGSLNHKTGKIEYESMDIPRGGIDFITGVRLPDPPAVKTTGTGKPEVTAVVSGKKVTSSTTSKPAGEEMITTLEIAHPGTDPKKQHPEGKAIQPFQSAPLSGSIEIHCDIKFLPLNGDTPFMVDLSKTREFKTGQNIQLYCRSNIDGYLVIFQQQNNSPLKLLYPYEYEKGKFIDNRVHTDSLTLIHPPGKCLEFTGDTGKIRLHLIFFTNDAYNIHKLLQPIDNYEQQYTSDVQMAIRNEGTSRDEELKRELAISDLPSKHVNSIIPEGYFGANAPWTMFSTEVKSIYTKSGFYSAINAPVPVFTTEIILDQLPK